MNRQRLDSPLVYVGAHNVYYVKLTVKVLYFTIHIHTQINQYVVISEFIKSNKLLVVYLNVEIHLASPLRCKRIKRRTIRLQTLSLELTKLSGRRQPDDMSV